MISLFTEITATTVTQGWTGMWLLAATLYLLGKGLVLHRAPADTLADRAAFTLLWPGMDYAAFSRAPRQVLTLVPRGLVNLLGGTALVWGLARLVPDAFAATWLCMAGFIWALHGGVFTLLAAFWRRQGRDASPLLRAPLQAASVTEFWGRRWNHAFRDLSHQVLNWKVQQAPPHPFIRRLVWVHGLLNSVFKTGASAELKASVEPSGTPRGAFATLLHSIYTVKPESMIVQLPHMEIPSHENNCLHSVVPEAALSAAAVEPLPVPQSEAAGELHERPAAGGLCIVLHQIYAVKPASVNGRLKPHEEPIL